MTPPETLEKVPEKYRRPNIKLSAEIAGISRSVFYKDYIDTGKISKSTDEKGNPYIDFAEIARVFGFTECLDNIKNLETPKDSQDTKDSVRDTSKRHTLAPPETPFGHQKDNPFSVSYEAFLELKFNHKEAQKDLEREQEKTASLEQSLKEAKAEKDAERARAEKYYGDLQTHMKLLEDKRAQERDLKAEMDAAIASLREKVEPAPKRSLWDKLLGRQAPSNKNVVPLGSVHADAVKSSKG